MKNNLFIISIAALMLAGCGTGTLPQSNGNSESSNESSVNEDSVENADAVEKEESAVETEESVVYSQEGFNLYRSPENAVKTFSQDEFTITHEVIDQNKEFVQEEVKFGDVVSHTIYQWNEDGFSVVYTEENPKNQESLIEEFEPVESPKEEMTLAASANSEKEEWNVVSTTDEVTVPYGSFSDVVQIQMTVSSETSGRQTETTRFFAPEVGLIKEVIEVEGENGYTVSTELEEISVQ
ncbi:hypothetical protein [Jeotgalibacillus campisalis]|uniref:Uncharacterized protein n=1 Tax=Jeotgalibacillus campisalis TaxID=220754 RepID=A0A0C2V1V2_9BACL|nr:hypothetical protein [Jeotgalibacillus campisalis]KIL43012.1 hypothetical protein KR50_34150 [Jeotgalibacillus campisalis]